eukprot:scaffold250926_cov39-Tisochrysis_lutea.AAC.2
MSTSCLRMVGGMKLAAASSGPHVSTHLSIARVRSVSASETRGTSGWCSSIAATCSPSTARMRGAAWASEQRGSGPLASTPRATAATSEGAAVGAERSRGSSGSAVRIRSALPSLPFPPSPPPCPLPLSFFSQFHDQLVSGSPNISVFPEPFTLARRGLSCRISG